MGFLYSKCQVGSGTVRPRAQLGEWHAASTLTNREFGFKRSRGPENVAESARARRRMVTKSPIDASAGDRVAALAPSHSQARAGCRPGTSLLSAMRGLRLHGNTREWLSAWCMLTMTERPSHHDDATSDLALRRAVVDGASAHPTARDMHQAESHSPGIPEIAYRIDYSALPGAGHTVERHAALPASMQATMVRENQDVSCVERHIRRQFRCGHFK